MENYSIKKIKLTAQRTADLQYTQFDRQGKFYAMHDSSVAREVTQDFLDALSKLKMHALLLCELIPEHKAKEYFEFDDEQKLTYSSVSLKDYEVTGVSRGGSDETEGVVIIFRKLLKSKKILNICTPFYMYESTEENYDYKDELYMDVNNLIQEACGYLNGKYETFQMELFTSDEQEESRELISEVENA